jgi:hypothetical protein
MQTAVYWLLASVIVMAGLLREVAVRAWKRLFSPSLLHLAQEEERWLWRHSGDRVGDAAIELQGREQA